MSGGKGDVGRREGRLLGVRNSFSSYPGRSVQTIRLGVFHLYMEVRLQQVDEYTCVVRQVNIHWYSVVLSKINV